jgi:hypothetical protein
MLQWRSAWLCCRLHGLALAVVEGWCLPQAPSTRTEGVAVDYVIDRENYITMSTTTRAPGACCRITQPLLSCAAAAAVTAV